MEIISGDQDMARLSREETINLVKSLLSTLGREDAVSMILLLTDMLLSKEVVPPEDVNDDNYHTYLASTLFHSLAKVKEVKEIIISKGGRDNADPESE